VVPGALAVIAGAAYAATGDKFERTSRQDTRSCEGRSLKTEE